MDKKPLRVCFVNRMVGMVRGGGETFDMEISRHLEELGVEVTYLTGAPLFGQPRTPIEHPRVHYLKSPYSGDINCYDVPMGWRIRDLDIRLFERAAYKWLLLHESQFDLIQVCELTRLVLQWKAHSSSVPMVLRMPGPQIYGPANALTDADALVASGASMETFRSEVREDVVDVPNGVDNALFAPGSCDFRAKYAIPEDDFNFVFVGRLQPVKCIPQMISAFAMMAQANKNARLVIIGSGPEEKLCRGLCSELAIESRVTWLGELPHTEIPGAFRSAQAMIIPSWYESFSFVALEAMASGLPVISTATDWIPRMVQDPAGGKVVPIKDVEALSEAMTDLYNDTAYCQAAGERNREYVTTHFSWPNSAAKLLALYHDLLDAKRNTEN